MRAHSARRGICALVTGQLSAPGARGPCPGVPSRRQDVKKAARPGVLCCVWELLALNGPELPPEKQFCFCSASVQLKRADSFHSGSCLPLCLCLHRLFICCFKSHLLVTSFAGIVLNEERAVMAGALGDATAMATHVSPGRGREESGFLRQRRAARAH